MSRQKLRPWLENLLDKETHAGLQWVDKEERIFQISWRHASSLGFNENAHSDVFKHWAEHTGKPVDHSKNKSNFRCALASLKDCIQLTKEGDKSGQNAKRTYQFIERSDPRYGQKRCQRKSVDIKVQKPDDNSTCNGDQVDVKPLSTEINLQEEQLDQMVGAETFSEFFEDEQYQVPVDNYLLKDDEKHSSFLHIETNSEGVPSCVYISSFQDQLTDSRGKETQENSQNSIDTQHVPCTLPNFTALGMKEYTSTNTICNTKLVCGGQMKVKITEACQESHSPIYLQNEQEVKEVTTESSYVWDWLSLEESACSQLGNDNLTDNLDVSNQNYEVPASILHSNPMMVDIQEDIFTLEDGV